MTRQDDFIPIAKPTFDEREETAAARVLRSHWVTQGPEVEAFELEFARYIGAAHACAVSSGTAALHLALRSVGVSEGDEVITVSHSFIATANSIRMCGAVPVFAEIDPNTLNINPARVEPLISPRCKAILSVHQIGMPCDIAAIVRIAERYGLPVVEDAACAVGSELLWHGEWQRIGKPRGVVACFSFHPRKLLTTGDGGMLTTADRELDRRFRLLRQHGMTITDRVRHESPNVIVESYSELGFNYRMTDIQAAVGRVQLEKLPALLLRRRAQAARYRIGFEKSRVETIAEPSWARSNWQSFAVRVPAGLDTVEIMQMLLDRGIATRRGVMCAHREPPYASGREPSRCLCGKRPCSCLVESQLAQDQMILLPLFDGLSESQQDRVIASLLEAVESCARSRSSAR